MIVLNTKDCNDEDLFVAISCDGSGYKQINIDEVSKIENYMGIELDIRLLNWLLIGPHKAHWGNADLGSHLHYKRIGSVYKRGLFYCWNNFHN